MEHGVAFQAPLPKTYTPHTWLTPLMDGQWVKGERFYVTPMEIGARSRAQRRGHYTLHTWLTQR